MINDGYQLQAWSYINQFVISQEPYPSCQIRTVLTTRFDCYIWLVLLMSQSH